MARYTGPKDRISRRYGAPLFGTSRTLEAKNYPPGMHGSKGGRRKASDYAVALAEKQKLRYQYGVLERQFRRYFRNAQKRRGVTGELLLQTLEMRLDNIVFRLGLARSRSAARQLVAHGHISVNCKMVNVASYAAKVGDVLSVKDCARSRSLAARNMELMQATMLPDWLLLDKDNLTGSVLRVPTRDEISPIVNEQLIVELYSR